MKWYFFVLMSLSVMSCNEPALEYRAVYVLLDRSGSYAQNHDTVISTMKFTLSSLQQGDSFALARIDDESFGERNIVAALTFSSRPSQTNAQKRAVLSLVDQLVTETRVGSYTDITGGMLHAVTWLNATGARTKLIIVLTDFPDEPRDGYMREFPVNFNGTSLAVWNVPQVESLESATLTESRPFAARLADWQQRVSAGGGNWQLINDVSELKPLLH